MTERSCVVVGAGRVAGGFAAPLLRAAGWQVLLVCRDREIAEVVNEHNGVLVRVAGEASDRFVDGVIAVEAESPDTRAALLGADLLITAVGPTSLTDVGRWLAGPIAERLETSARPLNILLFENSRQAQHLVTAGLVQERPGLATAIGTRLGVAGAAVWRTVAQREITRCGVRFTCDDADHCPIDALSLADCAPLDGSLPGLEPVRGFDDRITEKLWLFNAGHATAAYLGWHAGWPTMNEALERPEIREATLAAMAEAQQGFRAHVADRPGSTAGAARSLDDILDHYANPALADPVTRVARQPRRKLAFDDRIVGPAVACLAAGITPIALAEAAAAALAYRDPGDRQAVDLGYEIRTVGAREVLATISSLDPQDAFVELTLERYDLMAGTGCPR